MEYDKQLARAVKHLSKHDPVLAKVIANAGPPTLRPHNDYYRALAGSIIGQQLSVKAAATIRDRFAVLGGKQFPTPEQVRGFSEEELRAVGLSRAKVKYVKDLAQHIVDGRLRVDDFPTLTNDAIIVELTDINGIGEWTAHMFLMFSLGRLDILPVGDLGIRKGVQVLYGFKNLPSPLEIERVAEKNQWSPYESIASWYVWRSIDLDVAI
jgi:DNA-3-methyladenine glycosylase II